MDTDIPVNTPAWNLIAMLPDDTLYAQVSCACTLLKILLYCSVVEFGTSVQVSRCSRVELEILCTTRSPFNHLNGHWLAFARFAYQHNNVITNTACVRLCCKSFPAVHSVAIYVPLKLLWRLFALACSCRRQCAKRQLIYQAQAKGWLPCDANCAFSWTYHSWVSQSTDTCDRVCSRHSWALC